VTISAANAPPGSPKLLMLNTTPVSALALLLTSGTLREVARTPPADADADDDDEQGSPATATANGDDVIVEVDGWVRLQVRVQPEPFFAVLPSTA
jgi:hypothetical protein